MAPEKHDRPLPECEVMFRAIHEKLDEIRAALLGDKSDPSKGLVVRVDRLEQGEVRRARLLWLAIGSCVSVVVTAVAGFFGMKD